jgi:hypothetical protein
LLMESCAPSAWLVSVMRVARAVSSDMSRWSA